MADYLIVLDGLRGYGVEVATAGSFRSIRGFATKVEAQVWIAAEQLRGPLSVGPDADPEPNSVSA